MPSTTTFTLYSVDPTSTTTGPVSVSLPSATPPYNSTSILSTTATGSTTLPTSSLTGTATYSGVGLTFTSTTTSSSTTSTYTFNVYYNSNLSVNNSGSSNKSTPIATSSTTSGTVTSLSITIPSFKLTFSNFSFDTITLTNIILTLTFYDASLNQITLADWAGTTTGGVGVTIATPSTFLQAETLYDVEKLTVLSTDLTLSDATLMQYYTGSDTTSTWLPTIVSGTWQTVLAIMATFTINSSTEIGYEEFVQGEPIYQPVAPGFFGLSEFYFLGPGEVFTPILSTTQLTYSFLYTNFTPKNIMGGFYSLPSTAFSMWQVYGSAYTINSSNNYGLDTTFTPGDVNVVANDTTYTSIFFEITYTDGNGNTGYAYYGVVPC